MRPFVNSSTLRALVRAVPAAPRGMPVRRFSYPGPQPEGGLTPVMKEWPFGTLFAGTTVGYFIAMYTERTYNKDEMVRKQDRPSLTK